MSPGLSLTPLVYVVQEVANGKTFEIDARKHPGGTGFSPDGKLLAIGNADVIASDLEAGYCAIKIWDTTGRLVRTLEGSLSNESDQKVVVWAVSEE